uniref:Prenyl transferase n=1 Tax=Hildenbrandia rubra TaxID=31481 RepID=A0A1C9CFU6_9FLOR|nr:prenyl transferase [Hildenbrandia rubra]AOM67266.1 prenyl transferase [Hildenbrandia rubra]
MPVKSYLEVLDMNLKTMVKARNPILYAAAEHLFSAGGKRLRPTLVFLVAQATMKSNKILNSHKRLAEITEIIHTASLVHDDVLDDCTTRRGVNSVHSTFNTKVAVLAGDFLFAQSSWYLANLENLEAVKIISKVIIDFAEGEIQQNLTQFDLTISTSDYIEKSFYKTASLIAASCKATAVISNTSKNMQNNFYSYGKHLGLAFQIIDDILDIVGSSKSLGKPAGSDLRNGNLTAPILFALEEQPELQLIIEREFYKEGDIVKAIELVRKSQGIQKAQDLAQEHLQAAINSLKFLPNSDTYTSLLKITEYILFQII